MMKGMKGGDGRPTGSGSALAWMLLAMATINGAVALGIDETAAPSLRAGASAGVIAAPIDPSSAVDPLRQVLVDDAAPEWIAGPEHNA